MSAMRGMKNVWIRIAVIRKGDDANAKMVWRLFADRRNPALHVRHCDLAGTAIPGMNFMLGEDPSAGNALGLRAWVDAFGDLSIEDGVARIALKTPPQ